jgi:hypothetical protein
MNFNIGQAKRSPEMFPGAGWSFAPASKQQLR